MSRFLDRLETLGAIDTVDAALGRLLASKSVRDGDAIGLAAALASAALAQGHSCLPLTALHDFVSGRLAGDERTIASIISELPSPDALRAALIDSPLVARNGDSPAALVLGVHDRLYLRRYFRYEQTVATNLRARLDDTSAVSLDAHKLQSILMHYFTNDDLQDNGQRIAVLLALRSRFLIVTGGPGAGKTSTVLRLLAIAIEQALDAGLTPPRIALTAPTGKAAARLSETLRAPASSASENVRALLPQTAITLHRLLGITPDRAQPRYGREHPLPYDLVVVDEASMLDLALAARLCDALSPQARLVLLGDRDQLASVEAGSVFGALCAAAGEVNRHSPATIQWLQSILGETNASDDAVTRSIAHGFSHDEKQSAGDEARPDANAIPSNSLADTFVELRGSHRFGPQSAIARFARALRAGATAAAQDILAEAKPELHATVVAENEFARAILTRVLPHFAALATTSSPAAALDHMERFRVLCALREGAFGALALNAMIEHELRRRSDRVDAQGWFAGRLMMIGSNDYTHGLFNGDIGVALASGAHGAIEVWFRAADGSVRALPPALLPAHQGAFALTVHKAQGSEFDEVLIVLPMRDARVLTRELLYTAVTRARNKVELWTSGEILVATIARSTQRWSGLADALRHTVE